jgi:hypothetical protein
MRVLEQEDLLAADDMVDAGLVSCSCPEYYILQAADDPVDATSLSRGHCVIIPGW